VDQWICGFFYCGERAEEADMKLDTAIQHGRLMKLLFLAFIVSAGLTLHSCAKDVGAGEGWGGHAGSQDQP
jgi:hypothetical protein